MNNPKKMAFKKGDRVQLSEVAFSILPAYVDRLATVVHNPTWRGDCLSIRWDGNKSPGSMHVDFLEKVEEGET